MKSLLPTRWFTPARRSGLLVNPTTLALGVIAVVLTLYAVDTPLLDAVELHWLDLRFRLRGPIAPAPTVVLAVVDEKSLEVQGRWPWPRSRIASLVDALSRDGAKIVAFDVAFAEPDENWQLHRVDDLARKVESLGLTNPQLADFIRESRVDADNDRMLAQALERSTSAIVLGYFFYMNQADAGYTLDEAGIERQLAGIAASKYPLVVYTDPRAREPPLLTAYAPRGNLDLFTSVVSSSGFFTVRGDQDGVVRSMPLVIQGGDELFPPLSILSVWHYLGRPRLAVRVGPDGIEGIELGDRFVPTDEAGQMMINYRGRPKTFPHYAISDILGGSLPQGTFRDKIVVVGATAIGVGDILSTPVAQVYPGPEIHATVIDNILTRDFIARPRWSKIFDLLAIVSLPLVVLFALRRMNAVGGILVCAGVLFAFVAGAYQLFVSARMWLNMVYPVFALAGTYTTLTLYRYFAEERERRRIKETFRHYVSPDVIEQLLNDPGQLTLGGQERVLTVLFSDLVNSTSYFERYSPTETIRVLSQYYERMTEQVFAHRGTLTAYAGDELTAIFGAPVEAKDHAKLACTAALAMQSARRTLAEEWAKIGQPPLAARTGINSGLMLVGNYGSKYRFNYDVLGDQVNVASRLEQLGKVYGIEIIIGEGTADLVKNDFSLRELEKVQVKGRKQALRIYELLGATGAVLPANQQRMLDLYAEALALHRQRRWNEAEALFGNCLALWPADGPSRLMAERCRTFRDAPPPQDWDGSFEHLTKG